MTKLRFVRSYRRAVAMAALAPLMLCLPGVSAGARLSEAEQSGVLRAAGVVAVATQAELLGSSYAKDLIALGVDEAAIVDGTLVMARLWCCRPNPEKSGAVYLYNPLAIQIAPGDFIELRIGDTTEERTLASLVTVTRVLQRADEVAGQCRWDPPDERLWLRYVACEWMPAEGWVKQEKKTHPAWYKPADAVGAAE